MVLNSDERIYTLSSELDYLTCGQCFREFPLQMITTFIIHKKLNCNDQTVQSGSNDSEIPDLQCSSCPEVFVTAWGLLNHVQSSHNIQLFIARRTYFRQSKKTDTAEQITQLGTASRDSTLTACFGNRQTESQSLVNNCTNRVKNIYPEKSPTVRRPAAIDHEMNNKQLSVPIAEIADHILYPTRCDTASIGSGSSVAQPASMLDQRLQSVITSISGKTETHYNCCLEDNAVSDATNEDGNNSQSKLAVTNVNETKLPVIESFPSDQVSSLKDLSTNRTEITLNPSSPKQHPANSMNSSLASAYQSSETVKSSTDLTLSRQKLNESDSSMISCCDSQKCGITVIPVTHENLKECCNAVVPKKRKRHFETKHIPWASRFGKRRGSITNFERKSTSTGTIYIDVRPDTGHVASSIIDNPTKSCGSLDTDRSSTGVDIQKSDSKSGVITRSVFLKPGGVFSIPFPCSVSSQNSAQKHFQLTASTSSAPSVPEMIRKQDGYGTRVITCPSDSKLTLPTIASMQSATISPSKVGISSPLTLSDSGQGHTSPSQILSKNYGQNIVISSESLSDPFHDGDVKGFMRKRRYPTSRPYKCEQCDNAFNQRIHLKKHMSKHTGIKPYKCQQCDYSTVERSHLKVHIRIHTGEKPFNCTYCEYATAQNSTLKIHLKRHHSGRRFECQHCDKKFAQVDLLQNHKTEHQQQLAQADQSVASQNPTDVQNNHMTAMKSDSPKSQSLCLEPEVPIPAEVVQIAQESQISSSSSLVTQDRNTQSYHSIIDSRISQGTEQDIDIPSSLNRIVHDAKMTDTSDRANNQNVSVKIEDSSKK